METLAAPAPPAAETPAAPAPPAAEIPAAVPDGAQEPGVPGWRRSLWGLLPPDVGREAAELVAIGGPVFLAQLMTFLISIVSSIFCGHLGRVELDAVTLAVSVGFFVFIFFGPTSSQSLEFELCDV